MHLTLAIPFIDADVIHFHGGGQWHAHMQAAARIPQVPGIGERATQGQIGNEIERLLKLRRGLVHEMGTLEEVPFLPLVLHGEAQTDLIPVEAVDQEAVHQRLLQVVIGAAVDVLRIPGQAGGPGGVLRGDRLLPEGNGIGSHHLVHRGAVGAISAVVAVVKVAEAALMAHFHHVQFAAAGPGVIGRAQKPKSRPSAQIQIGHLHAGLDHAVMQGHFRLGVDLTGRISQGVAPLVHNARAGLGPGLDAQGHVARFARNLGDLDIVLLVELQFAIAPAPLAVARDHHPVVQGVEVLRPEQFPHLGRCGGGAGKHQQKRQGAGDLVARLGQGHVELLAALE